MSVAGFLVRESNSVNAVRKKRMRHEHHTAIQKAMLDSSIRAFLASEVAARMDMESEKTSVIEEYIAKEQYKSDFLIPLRDEIQKGLSFVHDYKQINTQIIHNINVMIESRYEGEPIEEKLKKASPEEKAIYMASKFLEEKLNVAKFLLHPEWLEKADECGRFRFHGIVIKYRRIYTPRFEAKNLKVQMLGKSFAEIVANPQASSIIPHTFIDNAAKYSPKGGRIEILTDDQDGKIRFAVSSFGPRILFNEEAKIFQPFFRGKAAKKIEEEGAGYGLYLSQMIARRHFGTEITVEQNPSKTLGKRHWTTFGITFPLEAIILK